MYGITSRGQPTRCGPPTLRLGELLTTPRRKNVSCLKYSQTQSRTWTDTLIDPAQDRERWQALVNAVMNIRVP